MSAADLVPTDSAARRAWPWLPPFLAAGRVYVGPCGETVRAGDDGHLDPVVTAGRPWGRSRSYDPGARRAA